MPRDRRSILPWWLAGLLLLVLVLSAGCSGGSNEDAPSGDTLPPGVELPEGLAQELFAYDWEHANEFVRDILEDGHVSPAEYEAAVFELMRCLDEHGIPHSEPELEDTLDGPEWNYTVGPMSEAEVDEQSRLLDECDAEYLRTVRGFLAYQNRPSESELQERDANFVACLNEAGIEVASKEEADAAFPDAMTSQQRADYADCNLRSYHKAGE